MPDNTWIGVLGEGVHEVFVLFVWAKEAHQTLCAGWAIICSCPFMGARLSEGLLSRSNKRKKSVFFCGICQRKGSRPHGSAMRAKSDNAVLYIESQHTCHGMIVFKKIKSKDAEGVPGQPNILEQRLEFYSGFWLLMCATFAYYFSVSPPSHNFSTLLAGVLMALTVQHVIPHGHCNTFSSSYMFFLLPQLFSL